MKIEFRQSEHADMIEGYPADNKLRKYIKRRKCPASPEDIISVLSALLAAPTVDQLPKMYNFHLLKYGYSGKAGVDIRIKGKNGREKWRIVLTPISNCGDINKKQSIEGVIIEELVEDYHKERS